MDMTNYHIGPHRITSVHVCKREIVMAILEKWVPYSQQYLVIGLVGLGYPTSKVSRHFGPKTFWQVFRIGTVDVLRACDACADMRTAYSV